MFFEQLLQNLNTDTTHDPMDDYRHLVPKEVPWNLYNGDVLEILTRLPDHSYDGAFCDPPYGLSDANALRRFRSLKSTVLSDAFKTLKDSTSTEAYSLRVTTSDGVSVQGSLVQIPIIDSVGRPRELVIDVQEATAKLKPLVTAYDKDLVEEGRISVAYPCEADKDDTLIPVQCADHPFVISVDLRVLKTLVKASPSGGFMGKGWDSDVPSVKVWRELRRVLKPGAVLMAYGGTRMLHRLAHHIEQAGFELYDHLSWLYSSGFPKALDISKALQKAGACEKEVAKWKGYKTALKPAWEPLVLAQVPGGTPIHISPKDRFCYNGKVSTKEREAGMPMSEKRYNDHPTLKPIALNAHFTRLMSPSDMSKLIVPFSGAGSEMIGAIKGGWRHVDGIEIDPAYVDLAHKRLLWWNYGADSEETF